jgi:hypothetical protein
MPTGKDKLVASLARIDRLIAEARETMANSSRDSPEYARAARSLTSLIEHRQHAEELLAKR